MPLYEITLEQEYFGQQIINRWNTQSSVVPEGDSGAFKALVAYGFVPDEDIEAFGDGTIAFALQQAQASAVHFVQCIAKNLYSNTDFYTYSFPPGTNGQLTDSNPLSPTAAFGFTSDRTRSDIRRAQKRFVGLEESAVGAGGVIESVYLTQLQGLGDTMADVSIAPAGVGSIQYTPMVFGREKYVVTESGKDAYRYYATEEEQLEHIALITQWTVKPTVRTQTSRQYGRGS